MLLIVCMVWEFIISNDLQNHVIVDGVHWCPFLDVLLLAARDNWVSK